MARLQVVLPGCVVLFMFCIVGSTSVATEAEDSVLKYAYNPENNVLKLAQAEEKDVSYEIEKVDPKLEGTGCHCIKTSYDCGCCVYMHIPLIHLHDTACVNFTYLPHDYGISVMLTFDDKVLFKYTVSARDPPPICLDIPKLKAEASICIDFYSMDVSNSTFHGCVKLEIHLLFIKLLDVKLGCFTIPLKQKIEYPFLLEPEAFQAFELLQKRFVEELLMLRQKKLLTKN